MGAAVAIAASLCGLVAGTDLRLEADLKVATGVRRLAYEGLPARTLGEIWAIPRLALEAEGRMTFRAAYDPRLFLPVDVSAGAPELRRAEVFSDRAEVLHRADLLAELRLDPTLRAGLRANGAYGRTDLLAGGIWTPELVPTTARIQYLFGEAVAFLAGDATRRTSFSAEAGAFTTGGADEPSQAVLPLQRGLRVVSALAWDAARRDSLTLPLEATWSRFTPGGDAAFVRAGLRWRHLATRALALRVGAGAAGTYSQSPGIESIRRAAPWAEVGASHAPENARPTWDLATTLEPVIDRLSGTIDLRLGLEASLTWRPSRRWAFEGRGAAAALQPWIAAEARSDLDTRVFALDLRTARRVGGHATVGVVLWGRAQRTTRPSLASFIEWGGFLEVTGFSRSQGAPRPSRAR